MSSPRFRAVCASLACAAVLIVVVPSAPIMSDADDQMRYYAGGYVAAARLHLAPEINGDVDEALRLEDPVERGRRLGMLTPYSPIWILQAAVLDGLWRILPGEIELDDWVVFSTTIVGLGWIAALFWTMRRVFPEHSIGWLLTVLAVGAFLHQHTQPLAFVPRGIGMLATAIAVAQVLARKKADRTTWVLMSLGALFHNYHQILNVAVATFIFFLLQRRRVLDTTLPAVALALVSLGVTFVASPIPIHAPSAFLNGAVDTDWAANWVKNRTAAIQVIRYMAPFVALLVWRFSSPWRGALAGLAVAATVVPAAILTDPGPYLGEYPNRVGGAWNCAILALLLQRDWLAAATQLPPVTRRWAMGVCLLVLVVVVARMDARYLFVHRIESRLGSGFDFRPGPAEGAGLMLIPR